MNTKQIEYFGVNLTVYFKIDGKYYPATMYDPEEFPEIEIHKILVKDVDIMPMLLEMQIDDIYQLIN